MVFNMTKQTWFNMAKPRAGAVPQHPRALLFAGTRFLPSHAGATLLRCCTTPTRTALYLPARVPPSPAGARLYGFATARIALPFTRAARAGSGTGRRRAGALSRCCRFAFLPLLRTTPQRFGVPPRMRCASRRAACACAWRRGRRGRRTRRHGALRAGNIPLPRISARAAHYAHTTPTPRTARLLPCSCGLHLPSCPLSACLPTVWLAYLSPSTTYI